MANERWSAQSARKIAKRIIVEGTLVVETPIHLGSGDGDVILDMPLLRDPVVGGPLLPGTSIAGALRSYLRSIELGERATRDGDERETMAVRLFGGVRQDEDGAQSPLVVDDTLGRAPHVEVRDGVRIDPATRIAADKARFDVETWAAGTTFPLRFELIVGEHDDEDAVKTALAAALAGFHSGPGGITLGARKHRGYGRARVDAWTVATYDMRTAEGLLAWITAGDDMLAQGRPAPVASGPDAATLLSVQPAEDRRKAFTIDASFALRGSMLIRSSGGRIDAGPDMVHIHSYHPNGAPQPVVPGTSFAGVLRSRALRIANTIAKTDGKGRELVDSLFGRDITGANPSPTASRVQVQERTIADPLQPDHVQNRIQIDRFTGGTVEGALFNQQPMFAMDATTVGLRLRAINPRPHEMGLLLLVLKDLWTGDLPLGGESAIGRGRLQGRHARITSEDPARRPQVWAMAAAPGGSLIREGDPADLLEGFVSALHTHLEGSQA